MKKPLLGHLLAHLLGLLLGLFIAGSASLALGENVLHPKPPFAPPAGHPRVYFTAQHLPKIRANTQKAQNAEAWAAHLKNLERGTDGKLPTVAEGTANNSSVVLGIIESYAFDYALRGNRDYGLKAIEAIKNYVTTVRYPKRDYNNTGQTVFTLGIVYDWCYALLSDDDKKFLYKAAIQTASVMEMGWPPTGQGNVTGHGPEAQLQRDMMSAAVAMFDEYPEMYNLVAGRFFAEFIAPKLFMYPAHMHHQGSHYMSYRYQWEMLATWIFDRMGLPKVFGPEQQYLMYWGLYARRPDGQLLRDGDTHINNRPLYSYFAGPSRSMFLGANYFGDGYLKMEAMRQRPFMAPSSPSGNQSLNAVEMLVFNDPDLEGRSFEELPTTKYFPSPKGGMIARTGWRDGLDSPDMVVEMKINEWYFTNHQHLDAGAFQIYYKGALAIDSGYYQAAVNKTDNPANEGSTGYGSLYDVNYNKRSVAHNTISVFDPDEKFTTHRWAHFPMANDGGQRFPNLGIEVKTHAEIIDPAHGYQIGKVLGHEFGPDAKRPNYSYLKGDLRRAYSEKMRAYERSFMFLDLNNTQHPGALIVFDRVESSNKNFTKAWRLHGLQEPEVSANKTTYRDTRPGYNGKLTVDTLLPKADNLQINKIGGPGMENWVNGVSYKAFVHPGVINEGGGQWRIEISPKEARETDYFLHVLQVGDAKPDVAALPVTALSSVTHEGVQIADRVVLFGKTRDRIKTPLNFSFAGSGEFEITVADLQAGHWKVAAIAGAAQTLVVRPNGGVAAWRGTAGSYTLTYSGAASEPAPDHNTPRANSSLDVTGVRIHDQLIYLPVMPKRQGDTILIPLQAVAEKLGYRRALQSTPQMLLLTKEGRSLAVRAGQLQAQLNDQPVTLSTAPTLQNDVLMVPLDLIQTGLGARTRYDPFARILNLTPAPN